MTGLYGPIIFGTGYGGNDFQDMRKTVSARWLPHEVHQNKPLLEYGGPQLIELEFTMKWCLPISGDPTSAIFILQEIMDLAIPNPLIIGFLPMGRGSSLFVMTELSWNPSYFFRGGTMIAANASVHLKEYVDTLGMSSLASALGNGGGSGIAGDVGAGSLPSSLSAPEIANSAITNSPLGGNPVPAGIGFGAPPSGPPAGVT